MQQKIKRVFVPYGKSSLYVDVPVDNLLEIIEPNFIPAHDQKATIEKALSNPIDSESLELLTKNAKNILIITNDITRPTPSSMTIPAIIRHFFYPETYYNITILIANGLHRKMSKEEIVERFGEEIAGKYLILNHEAENKEILAYFGELSSGNSLWLNKALLKNDLIISEGFIEPHFFAGFSGGRKSILPGVAGAETIMYNHRPENISNPNSKISNLHNNPIHNECSEAAEKSNLRFILNVALNKKKQVIRAFAGHPYHAHVIGCKYVREVMTVKVSPCDIIITSNNGYPLDRNIYQLVKGIDVSSAITRTNGVIIIAAECIDGVGHKAFEELITSYKTVEELYEQSSKGKSSIDKWQVQILAKALKSNTIILVSDKLEKAQVESLFMKHAQNLNDALEMAFTIKGRDAKISIMPEGPVVIPRTK